MTFVSMTARAAERSQVSAVRSSVTGDASVGNDDVQFGEARADLGSQPRQRGRVAEVERQPDQAGARRRDFVEGEVGGGRSPGRGCRGRGRLRPARGRCRWCPPVMRMVLPVMFMAVCFRVTSRCLWS